MAKVSSLISKIDYFVVDLSTQNTRYELAQILAMNKVKENILVFKDENCHIPNNGKSCTVISKNSDFFDNIETYISKVEDWFKKISGKLDRNIVQEPERLLKKNEFNAAVISAVIQLEVTLRKLIEKKQNSNVFAKGFYELIRIAVEYGIVSKNDYSKLREWTSIRNKLVHSEANLEEEFAVKTVEEIVDYTSNLTKKN